MFGPILKRIYFIIYKNNEKQYLIVLGLLFFAFALLTSLLGLATGVVVIFLFCMSGFLMYFLEKFLKNCLTGYKYIIFVVSWVTFLLFKQAYTVLLGYALLGLVLYSIHLLHWYYLGVNPKQITEGRENSLTVTETLFLDFKIIENHFKDNFQVFLLLRKTYLSSFLLYVVLINFVPQACTYPLVFTVKIGFLILWWIILLFLFFIRYQIISFCNVPVNSPLVQKLIVGLGVFGIGGGTGFMWFHVVTTTPGITPFPTPVTGLWQDHTLGYRGETSAQLILAQAHALAYPGEPIPVDSNNYVDSDKIHAKLAISASVVVNKVNIGLP